MFDNEAPTPVQKIEDPLLGQKNLTLYIKRDDLIHPIISGNKWRKLKYNLIEAKEKGFKKIITFGGAYSNHIAATAAACNEYGFESTGIIRGDELNKGSNETLKEAVRNGMKLHFISREDYRCKEEFIQRNRDELGEFYLIPEGGSNLLAVKGCLDITKEIDFDFDYIVTAVGTGGTLSGLVCGLGKKQKAIGISALKGARYLDEEVKKLINAYLGRGKSNWEIKHNYHLGGYAKSNPELIAFIKEFESRHSIWLDPIYTGKMMMALYDMIDKNYFKKGSTIIALHTGGLQGLTGFSEFFKDQIIS